jgi:intracellular multiplication protein IcmN
MRSIIKLIMLVIFGVVLTGCAKKPKPVFVPPPPKPTLNQIRTFTIHRLEDNGVQVIHEGEDIRIVLRDDYLFVPDSANIRDSYKPVLSTVARLMRTYDKVNVNISAYLDSHNAKPFSNALSTRQAQVVSNFLWYHGIDARLLYAEGHNSLNPVDWNGSVEGRSYNRRVEISFRYFVKNTEY